MKIRLVEEPVDERVPGLGLSVCHTSQQKHDEISHPSPIFNDVLLHLNFFASADDLVVGDLVVAILLCGTDDRFLSSVICSGASQATNGDDLPHCFNL